MSSSRQVGFTWGFPPEYMKQSYRHDSFIRDLSEEHLAPVACEDKIWFGEIID